MPADRCLVAMPPRWNETPGEGGQGCPRTGAPCHDACPARESNNGTTDCLRTPKVSPTLIVIPSRIGNPSHRPTGTRVEQLRILIWATFGPSPQTCLGGRNRFWVRRRQRLEEGVALSAGEFVPNRFGDELATICMHRIDAGEQIVIKGDHQRFGRHLTHLPLPSIRVVHDPSVRGNRHR